MFININGYEWQVKFVNPHSHFLIDKLGNLTLGATDPVSFSIYISNILNKNECKKVLIHELSHASIISYGMHNMIHKYVKPRYWIDVEEWLCNYIIDYGIEIYDIANKVMKEVMHI